MRKEDKEDIRRGIVKGMVLIVFACFMWNISEVIDFLEMLYKAFIPLIYGFVIAYLTVPVVKRVEQLAALVLRGERIRQKTYVISVSLIYLAIVICTVYGLKEVFPKILMGLGTVVELVPESITSLLSTKRGALSAWGFTENEHLAILESLKSIIKGEKAVSTIFDTTKQLTSVATNWLLGFIVSIYMVLYKDKYKTRIDRIARVYIKGKNRKRIVGAMQETHVIFSSFVGATFLEAWVVGVLAGVGCWVLGVDGVVTVGIIVGVTNIVPYLGPLVGTVLSALVLLPGEGGVMTAVVVCMILILQQIDCHVIGPKLKGDSLGVDTLLVVAAVIVATGLWGVVGTIVGAPLAGLIYVFFKAELEKKEKGRLENGFSGNGRERAGEQGDKRQDSL